MPVKTVTKMISKFKPKKPIPVLYYKIETKNEKEYEIEILFSVSIKD